MSFLGGSEGKEPDCNAGGPGLIPGSGISPGEGNANTLQYSCLGNPMDRGDSWATVHAAAKSWTPLKTNTHSTHSNYYGFPWLGGEESACRRCNFDPWVRKILWRRTW